MRLGFIFLGAINPVTHVSTAMSDTPDRGQGHFEPHKDTELQTPQVSTPLFKRETRIRGSNCNFPYLTLSPACSVDHKVGPFFSTLLFGSFSFFLNEEQWRNENSNEVLEYFPKKDKIKTRK